MGLFEYIRKYWQDTRVLESPEPTHVIMIMTKKFITVNNCLVPLIEGL